MPLTIFGNDEYVRLLVENEVAGFDFGRVIKFRRNILSPGAYINNRKISTIVSLRDEINWYVKCACIPLFNASGIDFVAGVATGGITHGYALALFLGIPYVSVKKQEKGHGLKGLIDGDVDSIQGKRAVVVEDMSTTFESTLEAVRVLRSEEVQVARVVLLNTWNLPAFKANIEDYPVFAGCTGEQLVAEAFRQKRIDRNYRDLLLKWIKNPEDESWVTDSWTMPG